MRHIEMLGSINKQQFHMKIKETNNSVAIWLKAAGWVFGQINQTRFFAATLC